MYKKATFTMLVVLASFFLCYCGTTAVIEEQAMDTQSQDISINTDGGSDISKDVLPDISDLPDTVLDIENDDAETDALSDADLSDVITDGDISYDISDNSDGGGRDTGFEDSSLTDTSIGVYSISGKVTINGEMPESGKSVVVFLFDQMPGNGVDPIDYTETDASNDYIFNNVVPGLYYVFAIYDIDGDGNLNPEGRDPYGYYKNNPVEIKNGSLTGINIDIKTIQLLVASVFMQRQQSRNAYLISLEAKVIDPKTGAPLEDATVTAIYIGSPQIYNLTYNPETKTYEMRFNPYNAPIAGEGSYQFTIQHLKYGSQAVVREILHKPQKELVTIIKPVNNSTIEIGKDLTVEWKNPSTSNQNIMIQMLRRSGNQMEEVFRDEQQPLPNPYIIDGSKIDASGMYIINVISGRFSIVENGVSIEATSGVVIVNAR